MRSVYPAITQQAPELSHLFQHASLAAGNNALAVPKLKCRGRTTPVILARSRLASFQGWAYTTTP